jgi:transcriptional regulator with XRE-family HTH domain
MGFSQAELAVELGVRQQTISEWETGMYVSAAPPQVPDFSRAAGSCMASGEKRPRISRNRAKKQPAY